LGNDARERGAKTRNFLGVRWRVVLCFAPRGAFWRVNRENVLIDGVVPRGIAGQVPKMAQEIDQCELEQARLIVQARSLKEGLTKCGRS
jgi:hypothetical protein